jgi:putative endonuclease
MQERTLLGSWGESSVAQYLIEKGYQIVALNYRSRLGEIDLIARKGELLVMVEVKTRKTSYFSTSIVVNLTKQKKIIKTAKLFLQQSAYQDVVCRFDVALVSKKDNGMPLIDYRENAFYGE